MKEYFPHEYSARNDPKLQNLMMEHGVAGIGIWWCIVEQLYEQGGYMPMESSKGIAFALHTAEQVVDSVIHDFDLFCYNDDKFWSEAVLRRLEEREEKQRERDENYEYIRQVRSEAGRKGGAKIGNTNACKNKQKQAKTSNVQAKNKQKQAKTSLKENKIKDNILRTTSSKEDVVRKIGENSESVEIEASETPIVVKSESGDVVVESIPSNPAKQEEEADDKATIAKAIQRGKDDAKLCEELRKFFNSELDKHEASIPRITSKMNDNRKRRLLARVKDYGEEEVKRVFSYAASNPFLNGNNNRGWVATFDFIVGPKNFPKIQDGNYQERLLQPSYGTISQQPTRPTGPYLSPDEFKRLEELNARIQRPLPF